MCSCSKSWSAVDPFPLLYPMASSDKHWKTMARSQFSWEQEALDFIHERFPAQDNYRAWANFEFIADDGSINEVDVLVACPQGIFLIEIKSSPGHLWGDAQDWTWHHESRRKTVENPLILANRKCKRLKSLLSRQKALRDRSLFIEPLVFLSHPEAKSHLSGNATFGVTFRDADKPSGGDIRPGIMAAIRRRECPGLREFNAARLPLSDHGIQRRLGTIPAPTPDPEACRGKPPGMTIR